MALIVALTGGAAAASDLCGGFEFNIEPDMQIHESDLVQPAAVAAMDKLRGMIERGEVTGDFQFGALNQLKIIQGHVLLQQTQADLKGFGVDSPEARDSVASLCNWLGREGYWYD